MVGSIHHFQANNTRILDEAISVPSFDFSVSIKIVSRGFYLTFTARRPVHCCGLEPGLRPLGEITPTRIPGKSSFSLMFHHKTLDTNA